jgi:hypothetical protein
VVTTRGRQLAPVVQELTTADDDGAFGSPRGIAKRLRDADSELDTAPEPSSTGAASITVVDPDGNPVLIDQVF